MTSSHSVLQIEYQPKLQGSKCSWKLPEELPENEGLAVLGNLQKCLSDSKVSECNIDFRRVEWADPQPLLCLGLVLAESSLTRDKITLELGSTQESAIRSKHRIFLKFFTKQGFLAAFNRHVKFRWEGEIEGDIQTLASQLTAVPQLTSFFYTDCIRARIIRVDHLSDAGPSQDETLESTIEKLLEESKDLATETAIGSDYVARDILFQKLRKILYELVLNVAEHSHRPGKPVFAGIYARIRSKKPPVERDATPWGEFFDKTKNPFGHAEFHPNLYAEWMELFICDIGVGLTADIQQWKLPRNHEAYDDLEKAKKSKNPFLSIILRLFRTGFSRKPRHDDERAAVTGLLHLGHLLNIGNDYCRIYTRKGSWAGGRHPWAEGHFASVKNIRDGTPVNKKYKDIIPVSGTAYAFSIQPDHTSLSDKKSDLVLLAQDARQKILQGLKTQTVVEPTVATYYDMCDEHICLPPETEELPSSPPQVVVLRPPRSFHKRELEKWVVLVAGDSTSPPKMPATTFVLADLSPFQALTLHELLLAMYTPNKTQLDVYLVAENWAVSCVATEPGLRQWVSDKGKAESFLNPNSKSTFSAAHLAVLLRQMDSNIFWNLVNGMVPSPFFNNTVDWHSSDNKEQVISIQRYIDLPLALIDPKSYRACLRALTRCLALYPECNTIAADDIIASLVKDANLRYHPRSDEGKTSNIIVGSVAVTAGTVNRLKKADRDETIHLMIHEDARKDKDPKLLTALLWISQLPSQTPNKLLEQTETRPWRRILNTPHIAPLGENYISTLRYERNDDETLNFDKSLHCGRTRSQHLLLLLVTLLNMAHLDSIS